MKSKKEKDRFYNGLFCMLFCRLDKWRIIRKPHHSAYPYAVRSTTPSGNPCGFGLQILHPFLITSLLLDGLECVLICKFHRSAYTRVLPWALSRRCLDSISEFCSHFSAPLVIRESKTKAAVVSSFLCDL